ncbi:hypothetical protein BDV98DRAFT_570923 [Pterulicium gracile]|uniref:Uncharacterized protein n=1 Tax=Pterulicium gracile TaxID=1884261 RepID=A0A5C3QGY6_9AGAR|nr:hypothetical protein BDV98DRAFT_570923 [Pterula gracilis]
MCRGRRTNHLFFHVFRRSPFFHKYPVLSTALSVPLIVCVGVAFKLTPPALATAALALALALFHPPTSSSSSSSLSSPPLTAERFSAIGSSGACCCCWDSDWAIAGEEGDAGAVCANEALGGGRGELRLVGRSFPVELLFSAVEPSLLLACT